MTYPEPVPSQPAPVQRATLDAARERAIRILTDRFADDTLTVEEFEARLDRMYKAGSTAELDAITGDLALVPAAGAGTAVEPLASRRLTTYQDIGDRPPLRRVLSLMSETRHTGRLIVPRRLDVRAIMSDLMLDLRDAALPSGFCEIDVVAVMANVRVLVPPGVIVEGTTTAFMAAASNDAEDDGTLPAGATRVRLTGVAVMAEVRVRVAPPGEPAGRAWKQARQRG